MDKRIAPTVIVILLVFFLLLQAGGVIFLAKDELALMDMAACANAIGLNHFILWTPQQVALWQQRQTDQKPIRTWEATAPNVLQVQDFQLQLTEIFDQLRDRLIPGA